MSISRIVSSVLIGVLLLAVLPPYVGGAYYALCGDRAFDEQVYLDRCISHLCRMRERCGDPDLQGILDYTIQRYNKIGPWDVMFFPLASLHRQPGWIVAGCNCPLCPGVTLDTRLLRWPLADSALVLVHEAMHDYPPYLGHGHIDERERKLEELSKSLETVNRGGSNGSN